MYNEKTITYNKLKEMGVCEEWLEWLEKSYGIQICSRNHRQNCPERHGCLDCPIDISGIYYKVCKNKPQWKQWMDEHFTPEALGIPPKEETKPMENNCGCKNYEAIEKPKFKVGDRVFNKCTIRMSIVKRVIQAPYGNFYELDYPDGFSYNESMLSLVPPKKPKPKFCECDWFKGYSGYFEWFGDPYNRWAIILADGKTPAYFCQNCGKPLKPPEPEKPPEKKEETCDKCNGTGKLCK